jgi:hypothetical protein
MSTLRKLVLILLAFLAVGSCIAAYELYDPLYNVILESNRIAHFNVEEIRGTHPTKLRISGNPMSAVMIVRDVSEKKDGSTITVWVHLAMVHIAKPLRSDAWLDYELIVPDSVNEVRFGRNATPIWKRGSSPIHFPNWPKLDSSSARFLFVRVLTSTKGITGPCPVPHA